MNLFAIVADNMEAIPVLSGYLNPIPAARMQPTVVSSRSFRGLPEF
jgi:hypothetical protein